MKIRILLFALALLPLSATAQAVPACVCSGPTGCKVASNPYPPSPDQPTQCEVWKGGAVIASGPTVLSSTVPLNNNTVCIPANAAYSPGVAGSVACLVTIPTQPNGATVVLTMKAINLLGDNGLSGPYTFQSVSAIPSAKPQVPVIYGPVP